MWNTAPPPTYPLLTRQLEVPVRAAEFLQWLLPILPVLPKPIVPGWGMGHSRLNWRMVMERSSAKTVRSLEPQQAGPGDADGWIRSEERSVGRVWSDTVWRKAYYIETQI